MDPAQFGSQWLTSTMNSAMGAASFTRDEMVRFTSNAIASAWIDHSTGRQLQSALDEFRTASPRN